MKIKKWESVDTLYFRRSRNAAHYAGAYKGRLRAQGAKGAVLPRNVSPGSEAARVYLTGCR